MPFCSLGCSCYPRGSCFTGTPASQLWLQNAPGRDARCGPVHPTDRWKSPSEDQIAFPAQDRCPNGRQLGGAGDERLHES